MEKRQEKVEKAKNTNLIAMKPFFFNNMWQNVEVEVMGLKSLKSSEF